MWKAILGYLLNVKAIAFLFIAIVALFWSYSPSGLYYQNPTTKIIGWIAVLATVAEVGYQVYKLKKK
jgi:uncharacterized membrane protein